MATLTNGIATNEDIYNKTSQIYELNNNQCPTKNTINSKNGGAITINGNYSGTQCVRYSDINTNINIKGSIKNNTAADFENFEIKFGIGEIKISDELPIPILTDSELFLTFNTNNPGGIKAGKTITFDIPLNLSSIPHNSPSIDDNGYDVNNVLLLGFKAENWTAKKTLTFNLKKNSDNSYVYSFKTDESKDTLRVCLWHDGSIFRYLTSKYFLNNKNMFQDIYIEVNPK